MKNKRALYLLLSANAVSGFAQGISMLAIPWYFVDILEQSGTFGAIYATATAVSLFWSLYAGTLIDRYSRKGIFLTISTIGLIFLSGVSATGFALGEVPIALTAAVFCFTMFIYQLHFPALYAFGQEITERKNYSKTNSMIEIQAQATNMFGGAVATILLGGIDHEMMTFFGLGNYSIEVQPWKMHEIFLLDASTYLVAIILIWMIKYTPILKTEIDKTAILQRIKTGFRFLKNNLLLFHFGNFSYSIFVILLVQGFLLLPMYVDNHLQEGAAVYAISEIFYSFGAMSSGFLAARIFRNISFVKGIIILMFVCAAVFYICTFTKSVLFFCIFNMTLGLTNAGTRILRITFLFNQIPNNVIGRTTSVFHMINIILRFTFIVMFSLAFFSRDNNIIWAYFISATFILLSAIPLMANKKRLEAMIDPSDEAS